MQQMTRALNQFISGNIHPRGLNKKVNGLLVMHVLLKKKKKKYTRSQIISQKVFDLDAQYVSVFNGLNVI